MGTPVQVDGYSARLQEAGAYADDCYLRWKNALKVRNALVVEAVDNGHPGHQAARDIKRKQPHIIRILSMSDPELELEA